MEHTEHSENAAIFLSDEQWQRIQPLIHRHPRLGGSAGGDQRLFVEAVLCHLRTGTPWRDLPVRYGAWNSIYVRFKRWDNKKVWHRIFQALSGDGDFQQAHLNSEVVELHRKSADIGMYESSRVLDLLHELRAIAPAAPGSAGPA